MIDRSVKEHVNEPSIINVDGSLGEGGGQILRTSLSLSMCLGKPFRIFNIRSTRKNPGLQNQHLAAVNAAAKISGASIQGATKGSTEITFAPHSVIPEEYHISIGTAGSTTLLLQTLLPPLLVAKGPSTLILEGGTHNPHAPPFEFLEQAFFPIINRMGPVVTLRLDRAGYYPRGGGVVRAHIQPTKVLRSIRLMTRGDILEKLAVAIVANLPEQIAVRELGVIGHALGLRGRSTSLM
ncbi:MAG: RNA 3'-terminal phosphate cyclase [Gammaproteobacteria bacterium]|nr:RNA 3'-terminal phosphate cyclase [Gammaproteobacteria bacterium]